MIDTVASSLKTAEPYDTQHTSRFFSWNILFLSLESFRRICMVKSSSYKGVSPGLSMRNGFSFPIITRGVGLERLLARLLAHFQEQICLRLALPLLLSSSRPFFLTSVFPLHTVLNSLCPLPNAQTILGHCFPGITQSVPCRVIVMSTNLVSVMAEI